MPEVLFDDRSDAGLALLGYVTPPLDPTAVVLALPRGGVPVARPLADALGVTLSVALVRKLPIPESPEMGFGAVTLDGTLVLNEPVVTAFGIDSATVQKVAEEVRREIERRSGVYPGAVPAPDVAGRDVYLVDDGLATGFSMMATARMVKERAPRSITVAVPVAPLRSIQAMEPFADELYCLAAQAGATSFAVASFYRDFHDLSDEEVRSYLE